MPTPHPLPCPHTTPPCRRAVPQWALTLALTLVGAAWLSPAHAQTAPVPPVGNPATVTATAHASAELLSFKDFFQFPVGPRGLDIHPRLQQAHGRAVRLRGYMVQQDPGSQRGQFLFTPRPVQMSEHADGDADDLPPATVLVKLVPDQATWLVSHTPGLIELAGILSVGRQEADDGRVTWVQLQLQP